MELAKDRAERRKRRADKREKFHQENSLTSTTSGATPGSGTTATDKSIRTETESVSDNPVSHKRTFEKFITPKKPTTPASPQAPLQRVFKAPTPR